MSDTPKSTMTRAESAAWWLFGTAVAVWAVATFIFFAEADRYDGNPLVPAGLADMFWHLSGLLLVPALILTGIRQLMPLLTRHVGRGDREPERTGEVGVPDERGHGEGGHVESVGRPVDGDRRAEGEPDHA